MCTAAVVFVHAPALPSGVVDAQGFLLTGRRVQGGPTHAAQGKGMHGHKYQYWKYQQKSKIQQYLVYQTDTNSLR